MALWAADDALADVTPIDPARCAVVVGVGFGAAGFLEMQYELLRSGGARAVSPVAIPVAMPSSVSAHLGLRFGFTGPSLTIAGACASGAMAIGEALWLLRTNRADRVLCGGVDALLTPAVTALFSRMGAMSTQVDRPTESSRPFDQARDGFVLGEGAAFLVLERVGHSSDRLGCIAGYATNNDSHHLVAPKPDGMLAARCIAQALSDAGVEPRQVGHINAHGTATQLNDRAEAAAIHSVFDRPPPTFAPKSVFGHLVGGAGALEAVATLLSLEHQLLPPTANLEDVDPGAAGLDLSNHSRPWTHTVGVSNSFAFGGINAVLVMTR